MRITITKIIQSMATGGLALTGLLALTATAHSQEVRFMPDTAALGYAVRAYESIWEEDGQRIIAALEARTCLTFPETSVDAIVADATSNSGGPDHPMQLRASYALQTKRSTLVHELGHRHLWQLENRIDDIDGHETLFLVLDLVWQDVWGKDFAAERVLGESGWQSRYDYEGAWQWVQSLSIAERDLIWRELLKMNGFSDTCDGFGNGTRQPQS